MKPLYDRLGGMNPCCDCSYPINLCPWLHEDKAVDGWIAQETPYVATTGVTRTFRIVYCPLYRPPQQRFAAHWKEGLNE